MAAPRSPPLAAVLALVCTAALAVGGAEDVCPAGGGGCAAALGADGEGRRKRGPAHHWPHARGGQMAGGNSPHSFGGWPCDLEAKLAWSWEPPLGKHSQRGVMAPVVDGARNLYVAVDDSVRKLSPDGRVLWTFALPPPWRSWSEGLLARMGSVPALLQTNGPWMRRMPSLAGGLLVSSMTNGFVLALDIETGELAWNVSVTEHGCMNNDLGFIVAGEGIVLGDAECPDPSSFVNNKIYALNATDGSHLWDFRPEVGVWNFLPHLLGDGTFAFQTWDGGAYRLRLKDAAVLWHRPGSSKGTFTDGGPAVGPNGVFYVVRATAGFGDAAAGLPGFLDAYRLSDGQPLWSKALEQTPYTYPVVGRLREGAPLSVVTGVGSLAGFPLKAYCFVGALLGAVWGVVLGLCCAACAACRPKGCGAKLRACCSRLAVAALLGAGAFACLLPALSPRDFRSSVQAFDAETGELQWRYDLPPWRWFCAAGDEEGVFSRIWHGHLPPVCLPPTSSYPTLDAQGIFYMGHMDGRLYAIQDRDGDGQIQESEACSYDTGGAFHTNGPTLVPGLLAVSTCDRLLVFKQ